MVSNKSKKRAQESKNEEKPEQGVVSKELLARRALRQKNTPVNFFICTSNQRWSRKSKCPYQVFDRTEPATEFSKCSSNHQGLINSSECIMMLILTLHFALSTKGTVVFTETGFQNWKKVLAKDKGLHKHEPSECHKEAEARWREMPWTLTSVRWFLPNMH